MTESYPNRNSFHAHRLIRLLNKSCAANEIGIDACWLITTIAFTEDSTRYSKPVTFWTGQLLAVTGFGSWDTMNRARQRAIDAGWLHYQPGTKKRAAEYWTLTPSDIDKNFDDSPLLDSDLVPQISDESTEPSHIDPQISDECTEPSLIKAGSKRGHSIPNPKPNPNTSRQHRFTDADMSTSQFIWELIQAMQPGRKEPNFESWANDIRLMREQDSRTDQQIRDLFQWCNLDDFWRKNILSPSKLRDKFDNLLLQRGEVATASTADDWSAVQQIVRETYSPDVRNASDVEAKLTPEQFQAAKSVGLHRIADANAFDKETPAAYRQARQAVSL